jgi:hypothetical protein
MTDDLTVAPAFGDAATFQSQVFAGAGEQRCSDECDNDCDRVDVNITRGRVLALESVCVGKSLALRLPGREDAAAF